MLLKRFGFLKYLATIWWILQGIFLMCMASFTGLIYVELFVIICAICRNCKKQIIRILAHMGLIIYTIVASVTFFMFIAVGSPTKEGFYFILAICVFNIIFSIYDICKLLGYIIYYVQE